MLCPPSRSISRYALAANRSVEAMVALCTEHKPVHVVMFDDSAAAELERRLAGVVDTKVHGGEAAMIALAESEYVDTVMAAIVGLRAYLLRSRPRARKRLLLANKRRLSVPAVFLWTQFAKVALLLPVDSEHNAMFQCLPADARSRPQMERVEKILLTASGGPFRVKVDLS